MKKVVLFSVFHDAEKIGKWDFPGGPAFKTSPSNVGNVVLISSRGAKVQHTSGPKNKSIRQGQYCNKFSRDFTIGPHQKVFKKKIEK